MNTQTHEEVTTVENTQPTQVVRKTITQSDPLIKEEAPQRVYNKKKKIFRINQVIWLVLGFVEVLLAFRILLKVMAANANIGFTGFIYAITSPLALPFKGVINESVYGDSVIEWSSIFAVVVYLVVAGGLVYILDLVNPVSKEEIEATV